MGVAQGKIMKDILASMDEALEERKAIMIESNVPDAIGMAEDDRHRCEVKSVIRRFFPDGQRASEYFALVEKKRGKGPADKLRADCRVAWKQHQTDLMGQA